MMLTDAHSAMSSLYYYTCKHCKKRFKAWYWGPTGQAGGFGEVKKPGLARANFKRHVQACEKKKGKAMKFTEVQWQFFCRLESLGLMDSPFDLFIVNDNFPCPFGVRTIRALFKKGAIKVSEKKGRYCVTSAGRAIYEVG